MEELLGRNMKSEKEIMRSLLYSDKDSDRGSYNPFFIVRAFFLFIFASVSFVHDGIYYS